MRRWTAFLLILILLTSGLITFRDGSDLAEGDLLDESALTTRAPILIEDNSGFIPANGVSSGNGSFDNPYIIENWTISAASEPGITIEDTSLHFIIRNCLVRDGYAQDVRYIEGIHLEDVVNGTIMNCRFVSNGGGIKTSDCEKIDIFNNSFRIEGGVNINHYSHNVTIWNNTFENTDGIQTTYLSSHIYIHNNTRIGDEFFGIFVLESEECIIENNTCSLIEVSWAMNCVVKNNNITAIHMAGIELHTSSENEIFGNRIEIPASAIDPDGPSAMRIALSRDNNISNNTIINGGIGYFARDVEDISTNIIDSSNTFNGKPPLFLRDNSTPGEWSGGYGIYIIVNCDNQLIHGLDIDGISPCVMIAYSRNITVRDCSFSNIRFGVYVIESERVEVSNITVDNCMYGVQADDSLHIHVHNCSISGAWNGISLWRSSHSEVQDNGVHSSKAGIMIYTRYREGENITAARNVLSNNDRGLVIWGFITAYNNTITSNTKSGINVKGGPSLVSGNRILNNGIGIKFDEFGGGNTITGNMILSNEIGMQINVDCQHNKIQGNEISHNTGYAIEITDWRVRYSLIFNNSFNNNNQGGVQALDEGEFTKWDNGTEGGNYWSDYQTRYVPPATNDGTFWNTPYVVDGAQGNQDNYPLVFSRINPEKVLRLSTNNQEEAPVGRDYSVNYWIAYTGDDPDNIEWRFNSNASWLTFDQNHTLKGKPTMNDVGSYWVNISVTDGKLSDHTNFTLVVAVMNLRPEITIPNVDTLDQWSTLWVDYNATDENESLLHWTLITNATFLKIDNVTGVLSGTPGLNDTGFFYVNVSVSDGVHITDNWFYLTVIDVNDPPMQNSSIKYFLLMEDNSISYPIRKLFFNYDEDPLNVSVRNSGNFTSTINETDILLIDPHTDWFGNGTMIFNVSDGHYNITFEIMVIVQSVNDAPRGLVIHFADPTLFEGDNQTVYASFFDPDPNDYANITWIVGDIGVIGYGSSINLSLLEGSYNLTMRIRDSSGNYTEITVALLVQKRADDIPPDKDPRFPWVLVLILSFIIILLIGALLVLIRRRSARRDDMELSSDFPDEAMDEIPWMNNLNYKIKGPMEQALNDETIHYSDFDRDSIERGLKRKQKDGTLTNEEYQHLRSFIDGIIEE